MNKEKLLKEYTNLCQKIVNGGLWWQEEVLEFWLSKLEAHDQQLLKKIEGVEKDALEIGLTKQGRQIIDRIKTLIK